MKGNILISQCLSWLSGVFMLTQCGRRSQGHQTPSWQGGQIQHPSTPCTVTVKTNPCSTHPVLPVLCIWGSACGLEEKQPVNVSIQMYCTTSQIGSLFTHPRCTCTIVFKYEIQRTFLLLCSHYESQWEPNKLEINPYNSNRYVLSFLQWNSHFVWWTDWNVNLYLLSNQKQ